MSYSQFAVNSQFHLYGRKHFSQTGYMKHAKSYALSPCMEEDLSGRVFMITGANTSVAQAMCSFLAKRQAIVYMVGKIEEGQKAVQEDTRVRFIEVDFTAESSVRAGWESFVGSQSRLDGLVCYEALATKEKQLTAEGMEKMFACHLLYSSYLLSSLALPLLTSSKGRLVLVSSGEMYLTKFPEWEVATSTKGDFRAELAYAYAKRGQVLLAERWSTEFTGVKVVSAHPGWVEGVEDMHGDRGAPLRTPWEAAEGLCWLLVAPLDELEGGAFYLDRKPQVKHMAGPFFSEGNYTKNTPREVEQMLTRLEWATKRSADAESKTNFVSHEVLLTANQRSLGDVRGQVLASALQIYLDMPHARTAAGAPLISTHRTLLKSFPDSFFGNEAVDWLVSTGQALSRAAATVLMDNILTVGALQHVTQEHSFKDSALLYTWCDPKLWSVPLPSPQLPDGTTNPAGSTPTLSPSTEVVEQEAVVVKLTEPLRGQAPTRTRAGLIAIAQKLNAAMHEAKTPQGKPLIRDHRSLLQVYAYTFLGSEAVTWAVKYGVDNVPVTRDGAVTLFDDLLTLGAIAHTNKSQAFKDAPLLYQWLNLSALATAPQAAVPESAKTLADLQLKLLRMHTILDTRAKTQRTEWETDKLPQLKAQVANLQNKLQNVSRSLAEAKDALAKADGGDSSEALEAEAAQLKEQIDEQKQQIYFPDVEGWAIRMGTDGVYIGVKDITLGTMETSFALRVGKDLAGGDSKMSHQIFIQLQPFTVSVALDCVSVVGEKGSSIPNLTKDRLVFNIGFAVSTQLYFAVKAKKWRPRTFNCRVDLNSEGLGLPAPLVKWVSSSFVPGLIKGALVKAFPCELFSYLSQVASSEVVNLAGQIRLNGVPLQVLGQILNMGSALSTRELAVPSELSDTRRMAVSLTTGATSLDNALQAHLLSKLRRRLGLLGLKKLQLFAENSKWASLMNLMSYVATVDRYATPEELEQLVQLWQQSVSSYVAEDGLPPINMEELFQRVRCVDKRPLDVLFEVSTLKVCLDLGGCLATVRDILHGALREKVSKLKDSKGQEQAALKIEEMYESGMASLQSLSNLVSRIQTGMQGQLMGGERGGHFEMGLRELSLSLLPNVKIPLSMVNVEPSKMSLAMYAKEAKDGAFVIDVGVPPIEPEEENSVVADDKRGNDYYDPSYILSVTGARGMPVNEMAEEKEGKLEGLAKHFPTSQQIAVASIQRSSLKFRLDPVAFAASVAAAAANPNAAIEMPECFSGVFDKAEGESDYSITISAAPGLLCDVKILGFKVSGVPRLIARWLAQTLREERLKKRESELKVESSGSSSDSSNSRSSSSSSSGNGVSGPLASEVALKSFAGDIQSSHLSLAFNADVSVVCSKSSGSAAPLCVVELDRAALLFMNYYFAADIVKNVRNISAAVDKDMKAL